MPRKNNKARVRQHDTRLTIREMCNLLGITPIQRVKFLKYLKEVGNKDSENK